MNRRGRLLNLVRYVVGECREIEYAKLATILYLADREAYLRLGATISGEQWVRRPWGVDLRRLPRVLRYLRARGEIA